MLLRKSLSYCSCLVIAVVSISVAAAQTAQPKRQPDVPYVPTTEEAVKAMLKLAAEPLEAGFLHLYPDVVAVSQDPAQVAVTLDLREVLP